MSNDAPRVCVVGSSNVDLIFRTARLPGPGETLAGRSFQLGFGGKGGNQAVMAARLGARVSLVGRVGRDLLSAEVLRNYREQGVDTTYVRSGEEPVGVAAILVDDAARNCILVVPGANDSLTPEDVRVAAPVVQAVDVLLAQLEVPLVSVAEAFALARAAGVYTILNPAPARPLPDELLALADLVAPNEVEAEQLTGCSAASPEGAKTAARALIARGARAVIVTLGDRGLLLLADGVAEHVPPVAVAAVDPSGAGDVFLGSLAVFLGRGQPLRAAAAAAQAVAALSVTRPGTQASFPSRAEAEAFVARASGRV